MREARTATQHRIQAMGRCPEGEDASAMTQAAATRDRTNPIPSLANTHVRAIWCTSYNALDAVAAMSRVSAMTAPQVR